GLARRQDIREEIGDSEARPSRFEKVVRPVLSRSRRRIGANPISVGARLGADNGALLGVQTALSRSRERPDRHRTNDVRQRGPESRPSMNGLPTYQELRRGWVNTAALLGSGSLIRYESVLEALRPLGGEVARVSAWSRGERSRPACGRSVSGGQPNDDENCVVLLVAAVHGRH